MKHLGQDSYCQTTGDFDYVRVGKYSSIAENCFFHGADNHGCTKNPKRVYTGLGGPMYSKGDIVIGNDVWIGEGVRVLSGVTIGDGAIIGAGTVVAKDVPPYAIVVGNPQITKKYRFNKSQIKQLLKLKWWDWEKDKVSDNRELMEDINKFLEIYVEYFTL